ncbi:26S proteasome regulatory complex [Cryptosporidium sp. chipmunk genotype I]|uniref:26S proteasome regulatory complex n=1 Tax=Cryptosporidium sp. chipmunk genotype I TaxID=1280935 RepID=UPI00351A6F48|nr:26S proteasome regulatory complex [Cryptosporidium sp. chipmunk genotype I]
MGSNLDNDLKKKLQVFLASPLCQESYSELSNVISVVGLLELLLNSNSMDDITLVTEVLKRLTILGVLDDAIFDISNAKEMLEKGSRSQIECIRLLVAFILNSLSMNEVKCKKACEKGFYSVLGLLLRDINISIGESASKTIKFISKSNPEYVYDQDLINKLLENFKSLKDETRLRIIDTYISIGSASEELFNKCQEKGEFYSLALKEYFTEDILLKLVSMKLLEDLGEYSWGVKFIINNSTPELLIDDLNNPMFDDEIKMSIMYLLSKMANSNPELSQKILTMSGNSLVKTFKEFMGSYNSISCSEDHLKSVCAINCWGLFASSLISFQNLMNVWEESFQIMLKLVSNSKSEISLSSLNSWVTFFESKDIKEKLNQVNTSFGLKQSIETHLLPLVISDIISKPFPENRTLIYRILTLMIPHFSNITSSLISNNKIRDLLLNPNSDSNKDILYIKYDLVKQMVKYDQNAINSIPDPNFSSSLQEYVKIGPFYKSHSSEMQIQDLTM